MLPRAGSLEAMRRAFRWQVPAAFNLAFACCTRHAAAGNAPALIEADAAGGCRIHGFQDLERAASRLANLLSAHGFARGDRLGILLGQRVETLLAHLACARLGGIAVPLLDYEGRPIGALSIAALSERILAREARMARRLREEARRITAAWTRRAAPS